MPPQVVRDEARVHATGRVGVTRGQAAQATAALRRPAGAGRPRHPPPGCSGGCSRACHRRAVLACPRLGGCAQRQLQRHLRLQLCRHHRDRTGHAPAKCQRRFGAHRVSGRYAARSGTPGRRDPLPFRRFEDGARRPARSRARLSRLPAARPVDARRLLCDRDGPGRPCGRSHGPGDPAARQGRQPLHAGDLGRPAIGPAGEATRHRRARGHRRTVRVH